MRLVGHGNFIFACMVHTRLADMGIFGRRATCLKLSLEVVS